MASDVLSVADRLWNGELSTSTFHPVDHVGGFVEITDGVGFCPSFANVSSFRTDDGLVLVDTGSAPLAQIVHDDIRTWSPERLHTAVYSHGHIDHVFGVPVWEAEAIERGWAAPEVIAHHALPGTLRPLHLHERLQHHHQPPPVRLRRPAMADRVPLPGPHLPREPRHLGRRRRLRPPPREGRDRRPHRDVAGGHEGAVLRRPLHLGLAQRRQPAEGPALPARVGRRPAADAEPGGRVPPSRPRLPRRRRRPGARGPHRHGRPARLAGGPDAGRHERGRPARRRHPLGVAVPEALAGRPFLQPVYDEPEFIVHTVWRQYGGWWDGNPATLKPAPERALAAELAELAGGGGRPGRPGAAAAGPGRGGRHRGCGRSRRGPAPGRPPGRARLAGRRRPTRASSGPASRCSPPGPPGPPRPWPGASSPGPPTRRAAMAARHTATPTEHDRRPDALGRSIPVFSRGSIVSASWTRR